MSRMAQLPALLYNIFFSFVVIIENGFPLVFFACLNAADLP